MHTGQEGQGSNFDGPHVRCSKTPCTQQLPAAPSCAPAPAFCRRSTTAASVRSWVPSSLAKSALMAEALRRSCASSPESPGRLRGAPRVLKYGSCAVVQDAKTRLGIKQCETAAMPAFLAPHRARARPAAAAVGGRVG